MNETRYLLDTNVWLEGLLDGERADEVKLFLSSVPSDLLCITDLGLQAVALAYQRASVLPDLVYFVNDLFIKNNVSRLFLDFLDYEELTDLTGDGEMDYHDAYHCLVAKTNDLVLVTLNPDFRAKEEDGVHVLTPAGALRKAMSNNGQ